MCMIISTAQWPRGPSWRDRLKPKPVFKFKAMIAIAEMHFDMKRPAEGFRNFQ